MFYALQAQTMLDDCSIYDYSAWLQRVATAAPQAAVDPALLTDVTVQDLA